MEIIQATPRIILVGMGATLVMDLWLMVLRHHGIPTQPIGLIGRWVGHLLRGRAIHPAIASATPIAHEVLLGWAAHYALGVAFALLLVALSGARWLSAPTLSEALVLGVGTVAVPFLVTQPAMGSGIAASRTAAPMKNRLRAVANHAVFGLGLYLSASLLA
ncbi:MAG: DUF2938 domain-containing protein [Rhodocyclaceae bacterium]|nr:DUF2938 domain-containing protein [Rhodocyclaceae bacterium]